MKIAISAYRPRWHATWADLEAHLTAFVAEAAGQGADLLVFPEYGGFEAGLIGAPESAQGALWWRDMITGRAADWLGLHQRLAATFGVHILAGSICATTPRGVVNRAYLCAPDGTADFQDKLILTPYERTQMDLVAGDGIKVFDTMLGRIGVLICYDSEFPLLARAMVAAGVDMILVPSATDLQGGYTRVSQSCRARAIEGQCLIVQSPILGPVDGCEVIDTGTGAAGAFCPPDYGLPQDGIFALGKLDQHGWIVVDADPSAIAAPRQGGQVGNYAHWVEQEDGRIDRVTAIALGGATASKPAAL